MNIELSIKVSHYNRVSKDNVIRMHDFQAQKLQDGGEKKKVKADLIQKGACSWNVCSESDAGCLICLGVVQYKNDKTQSGPADFAIDFGTSMVPQSTWTQTRS